MYEISSSKNYKSFILSTPNEKNKKSDYLPSISDYSQSQLVAVFQKLCADRKPLEQEFRLCNYFKALADEEYP